MKSYRRLLVVFLSCFLLSSGHGLVAQEAVEVKAEPTPDAATTEEATPTPAKKKSKPKAEKEESSGGVRENMSQDEFNKAGLNKLSPDELNALNQWMKGYRQQTEAKAAEKANAAANAESKKNFNRSWINTDRIYSRIDGEFHGVQAYGKKAIIRLEDGTVWKQANESDHCEAKLIDHPPVMVTHSAVGYKMHVIGAGEFYVNPVRQPSK